MANIFSNSGSYEIVGSPSVTSHKLGVDSGSYAITGTSATLQRGKVLTVNSGAYAVTGSVAGFKRIPTDPGAYQLQGQTVTFIKGNPKLVVSSGSYVVTPSTTYLRRRKYYNVGSYIVTGATGVNSVLLLRINQAVTGFYNITGSPVSLIRDIPLDPAFYLLIGTASTLRKGKGLVALPGSYSVSSNATTLLKRDKKIIATGSTYGITGFVVNLIRSTNPNKFLIADLGTYSISGKTAGLIRLKGLGAGTGSYILTGTATTLRWTRIFHVDFGTYDLTGTDVTFTKAGNRYLTADTGSYSITGDIAVIQRDGSLLGENVVYDYSGASVTFHVTRKFDSGTYNLTGTSVSFFRLVRKLEANSGAYLLTGTLAGLLYPVKIFPVSGGTYSYSGSPQGLLATHPPLLAGIGTYSYTGLDVLFRATRIVAESGTYDLEGPGVTFSSTHRDRWTKQPTRPSSSKKQSVVTNTWELQPVSQVVEG